MTDAAKDAIVKDAVRRAIEEVAQKFDTEARFHADIGATDRYLLNKQAARDIRALANDPEFMARIVKGGDAAEAQPEGTTREAVAAKIAAIQAMVAEADRLTAEIADALGLEAIEIDELHDAAWNGNAKDAAAWLDAYYGEDDQ